MWLNAIWKCQTKLKWKAWVTARMVIKWRVKKIKKAKLQRKIIRDDRPWCFNLLYASYLRYWDAKTQKYGLSPRHKARRPGLLSSQVLRDKDFDDDENIDQIYWVVSSCASNSEVSNSWASARENQLKNALKDSLLVFRSCLRSGLFLWRNFLRSSRLSMGSPHKGLYALMPWYIRWWTKLCYVWCYTHKGIIPGIVPSFRKDTGRSLGKIEGKAGFGLRSRRQGICP